MARNPYDLSEDFDNYRSLLEEIDLLRDVHRGLADVRAGRVVPHEEARARLMARSPHPLSPSPATP
jgi:hypothetical protein